MSYINLYFEDKTNKKIIIVEHINLATCVSDLTEFVCEKMKIDANRRKLYYQEKEMEENRILHDYALKSNEILYLVEK